MFYHGHFTHPDLWMLWFAVMGTYINSVLIVGLLIREKK